MQLVAVAAVRVVGQICLLTFLLLAACGGPGSDLPLLPDAGPPDYRLGPADQVRIITYGEENLTGEFRVNDRGNISLPLVGTVHAAGLTSSALEGAVAAALRHGDLVRGPSVAVEVISYRSIYCLDVVIHNFDMVMGRPALSRVINKSGHFRAALHRRCPPCIAL